MFRIKLVYAIVLVPVGLWGVLQTAQADCAVTGTTGSGGEIVMCTGSDTDGYDGTPNGDDITVPVGATVDHPTSDTIDLVGGDDVMLISGGTITSGSDAVETGSGNDTVTMTSGSVTGDSDGFRLQGGDDSIIVTGGIITGTADQGIQTGPGNDYISISNATVTGDGALEGESDNDIIELGDNAVVNGLIDGGSETDILRFSMAVAPGDLSSVQSALASANPASGSITINGLTYTWIDFESIEDNVRGSAATSVPSLQFWGILLLIGLVLLFSQQFIRTYR